MLWQEEWQIPPGKDQEILRSSGGPPVPSVVLAVYNDTDEEIEIGGSVTSIYIAARAHQLFTISGVAGNLSIINKSGKSTIRGRTVLIAVL